MNADLTTDEVLRGIDLGGCRVLVTGAAVGLGRETARALAAHGAAVTVAGRDATRMEQVAVELRAETANPAVDALELDLASLESVRSAARSFMESHASLDILVNNAGIMACPLARTSEGHEMQFGVCHLGHFLLTCLLLPRLLECGPARIVNLSSAGHKLSPFCFEDPDFLRRPYDKWQAYGQAKTANILFTVELERRLAARGIHAFAVHPGAIAETRLGRHLVAEDFALLRGRSGEGGFRYKTLAAGAATSVWASIAPELTGRGGVYLENCSVAEINDDPFPGEGGCRSYALDPDAAGQLWRVSEEMCGQGFDWGADA